MTKSRDELAEKWVMNCSVIDGSALLLETNAFKAGYDAGYQAAIEKMRSEEAREGNENCDEYLESWARTSGQDWAIWLEKQREK